MVFLMDLLTYPYLNGFSKNLSFEDFQNFQEIGAYLLWPKIDDSSTMAVINLGTL